MQHETILVVESSARLRAALRMGLESGGYGVLEAENGRAALDLARRHHPHAVVLNLELPGLTGRQVVRALKQDFRTTEIPVLAVSARDEFTSLDAARAGFATLLRMPFTAADLCSALARAIADSDAVPRGGIVALAPSAALQAA